MGWAEIARRQDGIISAAQLQETGLSWQAINRWRRAGVVESVNPGVYLVRGAPLTYRARLWSAVLATSGTLGFATAAHLWGLIDEPGPRIHVIIDRNARVAPPVGIRLHRITLLTDTLDQRDRLPITNRLTTLLDYIGRLPFSQAARLADRAVQTGRLTPQNIEHRLMRQPGRTGNVTLRRLLDQLSDGAAAESERILHRLLRRAGIRNWRPNHRVWDAGTLVAVVDVALVAEKIAIEVDGWAFHTDADQFQGDRVRQNRLVAAGWTVLRFTWADLTLNPDYVMKAIQVQLATQRPR
jgi:very-short-patch-repair endonuclease